MRFVTFLKLVNPLDNLTLQPWGPASLPNSVIRFSHSSQTLGFKKRTGEHKVDNVLNYNQTLPITKTYRLKLHGQAAVYMNNQVHLLVRVPDKQPISGEELPALRAALLQDSWQSHCLRESA